MKKGAFHRYAPFLSSEGIVSFFCLFYNEKKNGGGALKRMEVVCGILIRNKKVFIAKRKSIHANGIWEFPGGKIEQGESAEAAIIRELQEELHIHAQVVQYVCDTIDHQEGWEIHVRAYICFSEEEPNQLDVHSEGRWVDYREVYDYAFQKADRTILDHLQEVLSC